MTEQNSWNAKAPNPLEDIQRTIEIIEKDTGFHQPVILGTFFQLKLYRIVQKFCAHCKYLFDCKNNNFESIIETYFSHEECLRCEYFGDCIDDLQKSNYCPVEKD